MTFYDLIHRVSPEEIRQVLINMCDESDPEWPLDKYVKYHLFSYFQLLEMKPVETSMIIDVQWFDADEIDIKIHGDKAQEECAGYCVSGHDPNDSFDDFSYLGKVEEGIKQHFAIEHTSWSKWLGMKLSIGTMMKPYPVVLGECLWEMTFMGNSPTEVEERSGCLMDKCKERMEALNNGELDTVPLDNLE